MGVDEAGSGEQPRGQAGTPARLVVVLGRSAGPGRICRVDVPGRVLRIWSLLNDADNELHQVSLPPAAAPRLQRQLDALTGELERSVSPALAPDVTAAGAEFVDAAAVIDGQMDSARAWPDHPARMREFIAILRSKSPA